MNKLKSERYIQKLNNSFCEYIETFMSLSDDLKIGFLNLMIINFFDIINAFNLVATEVLEDIKFIIFDYLDNISKRNFEKDDNFIFEG